MEYDAVTALMGHIHATHRALFEETATEPTRGPVANPAQGLAFEGQSSNTLGHDLSVQIARVKVSDFGKLGPIDDFHSAA